jgi:hypothetical protein
MSPSRRNRLILVAATALLVVGGVVLKVHLEGTRALATADATWETGDMDRAQLLYLRAGRWYLPGNGVRERAAERLLGLARARHAESDWPGAVAAYDDVRALFYGSSSLAPAGGETLDAANQEMAVTLAEWKRASGSTETREALADRYLAQLVVHDIPSPLWSLLMGLALFGWLGTLGVVAWRHDRILRRWPWLAAAAGFFALWILALRFMGP